MYGESATVSDMPHQAPPLRAISGYASGLEYKCIFQPIAVESLGPLSETACQFLKDLGRRIPAQSGDERESAFLFQRLSVVIQRFNAILLQTVLRGRPPGLMVIPSFTFSNQFFLPRPRYRRCLGH